MKQRCSSSKASGLRDTEGRVRALTREVGSLREELRREGKRREWAVGVSKEREDEALQCRERVKELSYVNKKLSQELATSQDAARSGAAKNRAAVQSLKDGLAEVENAVAARGAEGKQRLDLLYTGLQTLEGLLLTPAPASVPGGTVPLPAALCPEVQRILGECMRCCASVSGLLVGPSGFWDVRGAVEEELELGGKEEDNSAEARQENTRLRGELARANMELAAAEEAKTERVSVAEMRSSLGQYRNAVTKLQAQVACMRERLDEASSEKSLLRDEVSALQHAIREREASHAEALASAQERETAGLSALQRLEEDTRQLRESCATREQRAARMQTEIEDLQAQIAEKEETVIQQRAMMDELQATISNQRNDIRSAMDLIVHRPSPPKLESPRAPLLQNNPPVQQFSGNCVSAFPPSRADSPTNLHTHYHWHQDPGNRITSGVPKKHCAQSTGNDSWGQHPSALSRSWSAHRKCRFDNIEPMTRGDGNCVSTSAIRRDMDRIDLEIADLDAALKAAAQKFS